MPRSIGISPLLKPHPTGHAMTGCGPPAGVSLPSSWARVVRRGFGSYNSDFGIFIPCASHAARNRFRYAFRLATAIHSLALASRRMMGRWSTHLADTFLCFASARFDPFAPTPSFYHLVSDLISLPRVWDLFSFRSRYLFTIGL